MSSYATTYLADGRPICSFRDGVDQLFYTLFMRSDWVELHGQEAYELAPKSFVDFDPEEAVIIGFRVAAGSLRDRLDVMGVDRETVRSELEVLLEEQTDRKSHLVESFATSPDVVAQIETDIGAWAAVDSESWFVQLGERIQAGDHVDRPGQRTPGSASWLMSLWDYHDPRYRLRAVLEVLPADLEITLDLADLIEGGWLGPDDDPRTVASDFVAYASHGGLDPIVLTEGRFDAEVLAATLELRRPHLASFIRFPDFNQRPEGGAAALRQTIRAFASAGIPNRVVGLFDNDSAARDAMRSISNDALPPNIVTTRLPPLELARQYPTRGPQGDHAMDVNGLAVSIELFLGTDVLADSSGLRPVEWGGYVSGVSNYQGAITDKGAVQDAFRTKVASARNNPAVMETQDWAALDELLEHLLSSIRGLSISQRQHP
ncbi:hypothetical protein BDK89_2329 [Ilumatobacter fluminis]|uniref:HEPN/Toprim N-terminal domain-containing protein n=1 Tax=Ilumatobacter fluminis TaxID=467091 RepID=A0A4R7I0X0_9ACTN|nr:HEPN/Toprim-associated domain-containing protein [Ilumatobacter fluminis]TDT16734.1 hypothetical protein BDK89_2329 [Ilumatobacter fluminis]